MVYYQIWPPKNFLRYVNVKIQEIIVKIQTVAETSSFQHIHDFFVVQKVFCIHGIGRNLYSLQLVIWFHNVHTITDFGLSNSERKVYVFLLLVTSEVYMTCSILDMFSKIIPKCCLDFSIRC